MPSVNSVKAAFAVVQPPYEILPQLEGAARKFCKISSISFDFLQKLRILENIAGRGPTAANCTPCVVWPNRYSCIYGVSGLPVRLYIAPKRCKRKRRGRVPPRPVGALRQLARNLAQNLVNIIIFYYFVLGPWMDFSAAPVLSNSNAQA